MSEKDRKRVARDRRRAAQDAAYRAALENPGNNRNVGSTYSGGPTPRRGSRRTRKAPRG
jgi:hypothetical protein